MVSADHAPAPPAVVDRRATAVRYRVLAVGCSFALLVYIQRQSFVGGLPFLSPDLGLNKQQAGYLASAFLLAYGIFQVPAGLLGDRIGARHLLTLLVLGWSAFTGLTALAGVVPGGVNGSLAFLLFTRFVFGAFQAGAFPVWARALADWTPPAERASAQGIVWMCSRIGGALGPFVFLGLFKFFHSWTIPLWIVGAMGVPWTIWFWRWFRNRPAEMPSVNAAERALISAGAESVTPVREPVPWELILRSRNVWALCAMYGCVGFAGNFITNLLPVYLKTDRHLSDETTTWLSGMPLACGVVSCLLGGVLSDWVTRHWRSRKWGRRLNASIGLLLAGGALLAIPWVQPVWLLGFLFCASFFCNDLTMGPAWAACTDVGERYAGTVSGAMNMTGQFTGAAGMALAGYLLQHGHELALFSIFGGSYALASLCWLAVDVTRPITPIREPDPA